MHTSLAMQSLSLIAAARLRSALTHLSRSRLLRQFQKQGRTPWSRFWNPIWKDHKDFEKHGYVPVPKSKMKQVILSAALPFPQPTHTAANPRRSRFCAGAKVTQQCAPQISGNTDLVDFLGTPHEHRAQIALAPLRSPFVLCVCVRVQAEKWLDENDPKRVEVIKAEKKSAAKRLQVTPTLYLSPGL
jgi:hypothetical protein